MRESTRKVIRIWRACESPEGVSGWSREAETFGSLCLRYNVLTPDYRLIIVSKYLRSPFNHQLILQYIPHFTWNQCVWRKVGVEGSTGRPDMATVGSTERARHRA